MGNYSRGFAGEYAGNYSRNFAGEYVGNYTRAFAGEYTGAYSGTYSRDFSGQYVGNYSRNFAGEYTGTYSNTFTGNYSRNFAGNYARDFAGNFVGNYARTFAGEYTGAYTRDFVGNFAGNYSRGFAGEYAGTYTRDFGGNYVGNYSRGFAGEYTGTFTGPNLPFQMSRYGSSGDSTRLIVGSTTQADTIASGFTNLVVNQNERLGRIEFVGTNGNVAVFEVEGMSEVSSIQSKVAEGVPYIDIGVSGSVSNSTLASAPTTPTDITEVRFLYNHTGNDQYIGSVYSTSTGFVGNYTGAYSRDFVGEYTGAYTRGFAGEYTGAYTRAFSGQYVGNYSRDFSGQYGGTYSRDFVGEYTGTFTGPTEMVYQSTYGLRASGTLWFGVSSVGLTLKTEVIDQMSQPHVNKIEFYSGSKMIYSTETLDGSDFSLGHGNNQASFSEGHGITISGAYLLTSHLNDNNAVKSVYGNTQNTDHYSFDTVKTYGTSGLIETRDYSFNLTTNLVELPNGTAGFVGNYTGAYTRNITDSFVGNYSRNFAGEYAGNYARGFAGEYTGTYSNDFVGQYTGTYSSDFVGEYVGNYSRSFSGQYTRGFVGPTSPASGELYPLASNNTSSRFNQYWTTGLSPHTTVEWRNGWNGDYSTPVIKVSGQSGYGSVSGDAGYVDIPTGNSTGEPRTFTISADILTYGDPYIPGRLYYTEIGGTGNASGSIGGSPANHVWTSYSSSNFTTSAPTIRLSVRRTTNAGHSQIFKNISIVRQASAPGFVGNYTGAYTRNITDAYTGAYTRNFTGEYTGAYSRGFSGQYTGTFSRDFTGDFVGNYSRDFSGQYVGNYSRVFAGEYTGTFTGPTSVLVPESSYGVILTPGGGAVGFGRFVRFTHQASAIGLQLKSEFESAVSAAGSVKKVEILSDDIPIITIARDNLDTIVETVNASSPHEREWRFREGVSEILNSQAINNLSNGGPSVHDETTEKPHIANGQFKSFDGFRITDANNTVTTIKTGAVANNLTGNTVTATPATPGFAGNYTGNYSRDFAGEYTGNFSRDFAGEYTGNYSRSFAGEYTGTFSSYFTGNYTGNYSRTFAGEYTGTYSGPQQTAYQSDVGVSTGPGVANGLYFSTSTNSQSVRDTVMSTITGDTSKIEFCFGPNAFLSVESPENVWGGILQPQNYYFNNSASGYGITFSNSNNLIFTYDGSKSVHAQAYVLSKSFDTVKTYDVNGNLLQSVELTSNLTSNLVNVPGAVGYVGNYSRVRVSAYSRLRTSAYSGTYSRDRVSTYAGDFIGDYARNFAGNYTRSFEGNYARSFLGNYVGATISDSLTNVTETYTLYVRVA